MNLQKQSAYYLIEKAIEYFIENAQHPIHLDDVATKLDLSLAQFNELFESWANVSPIQFFENIQLKKAKVLQNKSQGTLFETNIHKLNTNSNSDVSIHIEEMEPENDKKATKLMLIEYNFYESPFGKLLLANTEKGICYASFIENESKSFSSLENFFPNASFKKQTSWIQQNALLIFEGDQDAIEPINLNVQGSNFQLAVWNALLTIPLGQHSTYGAIAQKIGRPKAARAVGTAIGQNPIAYLIPCHRVIQASGNIGGYMWGSTRKTALLGWEFAKRKII